MFTYSIFCNAQGVLTKFGINQANKSFAISYYKNNERELAVVPMLHINRPEFYKITKSKIDSLRNNGYKVFYESIESNINDSIQLDIIMRKFRRITGFALLDYMDTKNEEFKFLQNQKFVSQNEVDYGVDYDIDYRADLNLEDLIYHYENKYGDIILNDCDYSTQFGKKYRCSNVESNNVYYILNTLRDSHVLNEIKQSDFKKIVLVYGRIHIMDLHSKFINIGWQHQKHKTDRITNF